METGLWSRSLWRNNSIDYIFGVRIVEYDMKSAGLSLIKEFNLLPNEMISKLEMMPKHARDVEIGNMQKKDKDFSNKLGKAFVEGRRLFFQSNNLNEDKLISIKKDAFFTVDAFCSELDFGNIHFVPKNKYSSFLSLNKIEFYFNTMMRQVDIKGLGQGESHDNIVELHGDYMLDFLFKFVRAKEINSTRDEIAYMLTSFIRDYRNKNLPIEYYRHLSRDNTYRVWSDELEDYFNISETGDIEAVDIRPNYFDYIVPLIEICM